MTIALYIQNDKLRACAIKLEVGGHTFHCSLILTSVHTMHSQRPSAFVKFISNSKWKNHPELHKADGQVMPKPTVK